MAISESILSGGPELYGLLLGCPATGEPAGSLTAGVVPLSIPKGSAVRAARLSSGMAVALVAARPHAVGVAVGLALYGAFSAPLAIWGQTLRMKIVPSDFHGRCFAIMRTLMQTGGPLGGLSAGFAVPLLGVRAVIAAIALVTCLSGAAGFASAALRRAR